MLKTPCPVCNFALTDSGKNGDLYQFDCANCGQYALSGTAKSMVKPRVAESPKFAAILSHAIRRMQRANDWPCINSDVITRLEYEVELPDPVLQGENLVLWLGHSLEHPGDTIKIDFATARARVGAYNEDGVQFILRSLRDRHMVEIDTVKDGVQARLSFDGWQMFHNLTRRSSAGPRAFMAMAFGNECLSEVFLHHFKPAVALAGFQLFRVDEEPQAGLIDERLRVEIRRSRFVVADLTDGNHGAYWEAGFAEGLGKPVIYTCERSVFESCGTHFDTSHLHTIVWDSTDPHHAANELKATIRATLPDEARMSDS